jgi:hypothetical protein
MEDFNFNHVEKVNSIRLLLFNNNLGGTLFGKNMTNAEMRRALYEMENQQLLLTYYIEDNSMHIY